MNRPQQFSMSKYKCPYCFIKCETISDWVDHIIREIEFQKPIACSYCNEIFTDYRHTMQHVVNRYCHKKVPIAVCGYCNKKHKNIDSRLFHERHECFIAMMSNPKTFYECDQLFTMKQKNELDNLME